MRQGLLRSWQLAESAANFQFYRSHVFSNLYRCLALSKVLPFIALMLLVVATSQSNIVFNYFSITNRFYACLVCSTSTIIGNIPCQFEIDIFLK